MSYKALLILTLSFMPSVWLFGEELEEPKQFEMVQAIQPRNEGALWLYSSKAYEDGKWSPSGSSREDVEEVIEIDGVKCYKIKLTIDWRGLMDRMAGAELGEDDYSYFWEYVNETGSYNYSGGDTDEMTFPAPTSLDEFELTLPYPVEKGHAYIAEGSNYKVVETETKIVVPAGEFVCTVYQILYDEDPEYITRERLYMSKGVGLVRWEEQEKVEGKWQLTYQDDLIRYDLKVPAATETEVEDKEEESEAAPAPTAAVL